MSNLVPDCYNHAVRDCPYPPQCTECLPIMIAKEGLNLEVWSENRVCVDRNAANAGNQDLEQLVKLRLLGFNGVMVHARIDDVERYSRAGWPRNEMVLILPWDPIPDGYDNYDAFIRWLTPFLSTNSVKGIYFEEPSFHTADWNTIETTTDLRRITRLQWVIETLRGVDPSHLGEISITGYSYRWNACLIEALTLAGFDPPIAHTAITDSIIDHVLDWLLVNDIQYLRDRGCIDEQGRLRIDGYPLFTSDPFGELINYVIETENLVLKYRDDSYVPATPYFSGSITAISDQTPVWRSLAERIREMNIGTIEDGFGSHIRGGAWISSALGGVNFSRNTGDSRMFGNPEQLDIYTTQHSSLGDPEELRMLISEFARLHNENPEEFDTLSYYQGDLNVELAIRFLGFFAARQNADGIGSQSSGSGTQITSPCDSFLISGGREVGIYDLSEQPPVAMHNELYRLCMENEQSLFEQMRRCIYDPSLSFLQWLANQPNVTADIRRRAQLQIEENNGAVVDGDILLYFANFMSEHCDIFRQYTCKLYDIRLQQFIEAAKENGLLKEDYSQPGHTVYCRCTDPDCEACRGKDPRLVAYWRATPNCNTPIAATPAQPYAPVSCCRPDREPIIPCADKRGDAGNGRDSLNAMLRTTPGKQKTQDKRYNDRMTNDFIGIQSWF